ncbi:MAG: aminotransferase class V-fold PLP-dependent enzyme [Micrococcales bacterium]|nr:aminotransferase class V-fold PLP-dependent enzyme [Micrococcales bacterium]
MGIYEELGVERVINAAATLTALGGSRMPSVVLDAMREAAGEFVDMHQLQQKVGARLACLTRNEAAYVASGCAAGMVLGILGCRTGGELEKIARLGSGKGLPNEVIIQAAHRNPYDWVIALAGARMRTVGNTRQTFDWELESAIGDNTAAVLHIAGIRYAPGALGLPEVVRVAHARGIPVIVDAAAQLPPCSNLWHYTKDVGADLAVFSGGKELKGPQASGLMVGTTAMIEAARANGAPHQRFARSMKAGKEEIVGLLAAVERYLALDQVAERARCEAWCSRWAQLFSPVPGVRTQIDPHNEGGADLPRLAVEVDEATLGRDAFTVAEELWSGQPRIAVLATDSRTLYLEPDLVEDDECGLVGDRVLACLRGGLVHEGK